MKFNATTTKPEKLKQKKSTKPKQAKEIKLNWLVRSYLYVLLMINGFTLLEIIMAFTTPDLFPGISTNGMSISLMMIALNIIFLQLIAKHSILGFWGYCINALISIGVGYYLDLSFGNNLLSILGVLFLFGLLKLGGKNKAWDLLRY